MLKKSLKIGSILLLIFAMVAFIGCDSGSGDTDPEETPVVPGPGPDDPNVPPPPPVETVTGVTIDPQSLEILAGERQLFTATVSGTAADKTVKWTVGIADADYYNKKEDGTQISGVKGAGLLVIDAGQYPGTLLTVTAVSNADPSVYAEATVKVVNPGPRLAWTPNFISVTTGDDGAIDEDATSVGRLLDIYGKDIRLFDGEYLEGRHYSVRRVDNLNNSLQGGTITITGSADEGTITVTLNGNVIGDKGPIGITLYQSVLEGNDASIIDLESAELVYNVTSANLITSLTALPQFDEPLRGSEPAGGPVVGNLTYGGINVEEIKWTGLTGGIYTHREKAVATITLKAKSGYKFYSLGISESTIKAKFINGSPEVAILTNSGSTLKFTLTYTISAKTIKAEDPATAGDTSYVGAHFTNVLTDLIVPGLVSHNQEAPVALRVKGESPYYSLTEPVVWEGLTGKNFFGGKLAVAIITIPAKAGYTFEGTDIEIEDLIGASQVFILSGVTGEVPTGEIISAGDSLVFKLYYFVPKKLIEAGEIDAGVSSKLPVPLHNSTPLTNLTVSKNAPFTGGSGAVTWRGLSTNNRFTVGGTPIATITLLAKAGYEFNPNITVSADIPKSYISIIGYVTKVSNLGNKLIIEVSFSDGVSTPVTILDFSVGGLPALVHLTASGTQTITPGPQTGASGSTIAWEASSLIGGALDYNGTPTHKLRGTATIKPVGNYSFAQFNTTNTSNRETIQALFAIGNTLPTIRTITIEANDLVVGLEYPIAKAPLTAADVKTAIIFSGTGAVANGPKANELANGITTPSGSLSVGGQAGAAEVVSGGLWTAGVNSGDGKFTTGTATYKFTIKPTAAFTFSATAQADWNTAIGAGVSIGTTNSTTATATLDEDDDSVEFVITWPIS